MKGRLLTLMSALSLLLFIAIIVLWAASYNSDHWVGVPLPWPRDAYYVVGVERGGIVCRKSLELRPPPEATTMQWVRSRPMYSVKFMGIEYADGEEVPYVDLLSIGRHSFVHMYERVHYVVVPCWVVVGLAILPPIAWLRRCRRRRLIARRGNGLLCIVCGYDLRATPQRCPECGMVAVVSP